MSANLFKMTAFAVLAFGLFSQNTKAQSLFGSGAMQGGMVCPYQQSASRAGSNISDDERAARAEITRMQGQQAVSKLKKERAQVTKNSLRRKIEKYFDSEVVEFLLGTHIESAKRCNQYQSLANRCATPAGAAAVTVSGDATVAVQPQVDCDNLEPVPELLVGKWTERQGTRGNYCAGNGRGAVSSAICSDESLRPQEEGRSRRAVNVSECSKALASYRKATAEQSNAAQEEEDLDEDIADRNASINDARAMAEIERRSRMQTEAGCENCDAYNRGYSYQRPQRDWGSTISNVIGGLGLMYVGKRAEQAANENAAQLGYPSDSSYGYPYYKAGISGVINGLTGPGAYGCASTIGGGGPFSLGANGSLNLGGGGGAYGPAGAQGGAFGYPQNMYGAPWGGGAFNPGLNMNGGFNGPFGGTGGGQFGQVPGNGNMAMCFTFPCNVGGNGGGGG